MGGGRGRQVKKQLKKEQQQSLFGNETNEPDGESLTVAVKWRAGEGGLFMGGDKTPCGWILSEWRGDLYFHIQQVVVGGASRHVGVRPRDEPQRWHG